MKKVFLHLTYSCNARCIHCAVPRRKENMDLSLFKHLVDKFDMDFLVIGGGEPLLHKDLQAMIEYAHRKTKVKIETNGRLLTKEFLNSVKDHLFQMNVSLDGNQRTHNQIRGISTFNHTTEMMTYARSQGIDVAVWTVIMKSNKDEIEGLVDIVKQTGVNKMSFLYATPIQKCTKDLLVDPDEYRQILEMIKSRSSDNFQIRIAPYILPENSSSEGLDCLITDGDILHIDPKGDVYPCVLLLDNARYCMGNINDKTLQTITIENPSLCVGLQEALGEDYRTEYGTPICPCKTVTKEWEFDK